MSKTSQQFDQIIKKSSTLFEKKMKDYGSAWRILRLPSLTDQIFIKAQRIRKSKDISLDKLTTSVVNKIANQATEYIKSKYRHSDEVVKMMEEMFKLKS
jgi:glutamyl-tRNA reductase